MNFESTPTFRDYTQLRQYKFDDEKVSTVTSREQVISGSALLCYDGLIIIRFIAFLCCLQNKTESSIEKCFDRFQQLQFLDPKVAKFHREEHQRYLESMLRRLPTNYECLDSSRPWNVYWILQAAHSLNFTFDEVTLEHVVQFLVK